MKLSDLKSAPRDGEFFLLVSNDSLYVSRWENGEFIINGVNQRSEYAHKLTDKKLSWLSLSGWCLVKDFKP